MKLKAYLRILINIILSSIFVLCFFFLCFNIIHSKQLSQKIIFVKDDAYNSYITNLNGIKNNLDMYTNVSKNLNKNDLYNNLDYCYNILSNQQYLMQEGMVIGYYDIYSLNEDFINNLVDKCYNLKLLSSSYGNKYQLSVNKLGKGALNLKNNLKENSNYFYNNDLEKSYNILKQNYSDFSMIIYTLSNSLKEV